MISEYPNFLSSDECILLIGLGESGDLNIGKVGGDKLGYRKAKVTWFKSDSFIERIKEKISNLSGYPIENQEKFHFVKYNISGEYKQHHDGFKRYKTAMIYLNDGYQGGETYFPKISKTIIPETGKLVIWDNYDSNGNLISDSLHSGLPVEFGTKYIGVIWIRNEKFKEL